MELLQRDLQRRLLRELSELYPNPADMRRSFTDIDERQVQYNLFYLSEHGLVTIRASPLLDGSYPIASATITAAGIDFITDDGGLSAILGVVTVKLHETTVRDLLIARIEQSDAPQTVKAKMIAQVKGLPAEALQEVSHKALEFGIENLPDLIHSLRTMLGL